MNTKDFSSFIILNSIQVSGTKVAAILDTKPKRVATIINRTKLLETGEMKHNDTIFFEDRNHDWTYDEKTGTFFYFTRVAQVADVLICF